MIVRADEDPLLLEEHPDVAQQQRAERVPGGGARRFDAWPDAVAVAVIRGAPFR